MLRLAAVLALAASTTACLDTTESYDVKVDWTTENAPDGVPFARVWYPDDTIETRGYSGTARVQGAAASPEIEICVQLGNRELLEDESTPCQIAGCEPEPEFVPLTDRLCSTIAVYQPTVTFTF